MKTIKILFSIVCIFITLNIQSQTEKNILKINYTTSNMSEFIVDLLKKQISDPKELQSLLKSMAKYKVYSSCYLNTKTNESLFIIDSINEVKKVKTTGHTIYVLKDKNGKLKGKENFMGKNVYFKEDINNIEWIITDQQKEISGRQCKKAHIKGDDQNYVWFTPQIPVNGGPYAFFGLPGLVFEANTPFELITLNSMSYSDKAEFNNRMNEVDKKDLLEPTISLSSVFMKKNNFKRIIEKGK